MTDRTLAHMCLCTPHPCPTVLRTAPLHPFHSLRMVQLGTDLGDIGRQHSLSATLPIFFFSRNPNLPVV